MQDYIERRIHIIFGNNTTPEVDANELTNNSRIEDYVIDPDSFIEDFEEEFGREMSVETFSGFETIGDIVIWAETNVKDKINGTEPA